MHAAAQRHATGGIQDRLELQAWRGGRQRRTSQGWRKPFGARPAAAGCPPTAGSVQPSVVPSSKRCPVRTLHTCGPAAAPQQPSSARCRCQLRTMSLKTDPGRPALPCPRLQLGTHKRGKAKREEMSALLRKMAAKK